MIKQWINVEMKIVKKLSKEYTTCKRKYIYGGYYKGYIITIEKLNNLKKEVKEHINTLMELIDRGLLKQKELKRLLKYIKNMV